MCFFGRIRSFISISIGVAALIGPPAMAAIAVADLPQVNIIDADQLVRLKWDHADTVVIDARNQADRKYGYIEGSIGLSNVDTNCKSLAKYVTSLQTPLAVYCNGMRCERSEKAIAIAIECGYEQLYWFRGGFEAWKQGGYPYVR